MYIQFRYAYMVQNTSDIIYTVNKIAHTGCAV